ncbi:hypothetical protein D3C87_1823830 [compost metagenome]
MAHRLDQRSKFAAKVSVARTVDTPYVFDDLDGVTDVDDMSFGIERKRSRR